jgi:hypothetical protein
MATNQCFSEVIPMIPKQRWLKATVPMSKPSPVNPPLQ